LIYINFTKDFNADIFNINQKLKTKDVQTTAGLFSGWKNLISVDISNLELKNNKDMSFMFNQCSSLKNIVFGDINTENVENMSYMFASCINLESLDITMFNIGN